MLALLTIYSSSREVWEQSLSRREKNPPTPPTPPLESENARLLQQGSENSAPPDHPPEGSPPGGVSPKETPKPVVDGGGGFKKAALNFAIGIAATMTGVSILNWWKGSTSKSSASSQSPTNPTTPTGSGMSTPQNSGYQNTGQYQSQRRTVDRKRADIFGEPSPIRVMVYK